MSNLSDKQIVQLTTALLNREISGEDARELEATIESDAGAMKLFCTTLREEYILHTATQALSRPKVVSMPMRRSSKRNRIPRIAAIITILLSLGGLFGTKYLILSRFSRREPTTQLLAHVKALRNPQDLSVSAINNGQLRTLYDESKLYDDDTLIVPSGAGMDIAYLADETVLSVSEGARLQISQAGGKQIYLHSGKLYAEVAPQPPGMPMRLSTKNVDAEVLGTVFELLAFEQTRLSVKKGRVRCVSKNEDRNMVLEAGQVFESRNAPEPYQAMRHQLSFYPVHEQMLNGDLGGGNKIGVDPMRNYQGLLTFDVGRLPGRIVDAQLKLRIEQHNTDSRGGGTLRVFRMPPADEGGSRRILAAEQACSMQAGMSAVFDLDPASLVDGENGLLITLAPGGDDFWFSTRDGAQSPVLELIVESGDSSGE